MVTQEEIKSIVKQNIFGIKHSGADNTAYEIIKLYDSNLIDELCSSEKYEELEENICYILYESLQEYDSMACDFSEVSDNSDLDKLYNLIAYKIYNKYFCD